MLPLKYEIPFHTNRKMTITIIALNEFSNDRREK